MDWRRLLGILFLLVAVAASWLPARRQSDPEAVAGSGTLPNPGYYLRDGRMLGLDRDGTRLYELRARLIQQQPEGKAVLLQELEIDYQANNQTPWRLNADTGVILDGSDRIELSGNVQLQRMNGASADAILLTDTLQLSARERTAMTEAEVTLQSRGQELRARGLQADLGGGVLRLQHAVRGRFQP